jgi:2-dehydropantoate 2-reductase
MKIGILGAGAMGALIGGKAQLAGAEVTFLARGQHANTMATKGLHLHGSEHHHLPVRVVTQLTNMPPQDVLFITTKAFQVADIAPQLARVMHAETIVVPALNGMPWWYFQRMSGSYAGRFLQSVDPNGTLATTIDPARILGCVNYLAGAVIEPGVVHYRIPRPGMLVLGELSGPPSPTLNALAALLGTVGFAPTISQDIRSVVWHKLWGNIAFNPIGALTGGTMEDIAIHSHDRDLVMAVMHEARYVADRLGIAIGETLEQRIALAAGMGAHKTSMQLDMEAGRPTEIEAIIGAVREVAGWMEVSTPHINTLYSLVKLKSQFT